MKIVVTGSLGNISKPLTEKLLQNGHEVTVISSSADRQAAIEALGAKAAIGSMEDVNFLTQTFTGADAVYAMEALPHNAFFDHNLDVMEEVIKIGNIYKEAIAASGIKKVIHLSSIGAHAAEGVGILSFHYYVEKIFNELPQDVSIKFMRPVGFYYNLLNFIPTIKATGMIFNNYGGDEKEPWVSPLDIAEVIAEEFEAPFDGRSIRYIASDELSPNEVAHILGEAIGKPELVWQVVSDEQALSSIVGVGMNPKTAQGFVDMNASRRGGKLYEDYNKHRPTLGKTKLADYVKTFASVYNQQ
jgi:uncharacterized protein YbjT (DUF2867 family)